MPARLDKGILIYILDFRKWEPLAKTYKISSILNQLTDKQTKEMYEEFTKYILFFYKSLIINSIKTQRFKTPKPYHPLSKKWSKYKREHGLKPGFWRATEFLQRNLSYWEEEEGETKYWVIGFNPKLKHPMNRAPLFKIALSLEYGNKMKHLPPRPLFVPLADALSHHIYDVHFKRFIHDKHPNLVPFLIK